MWLVGGWVFRVCCSRLEPDRTGFQYHCHSYWYLTHVSGFPPLDPTVLMAQGPERLPAPGNAVLGTLHWTGPSLPDSLSFLSLGLLRFTIFWSSSLTNPPEFGFHLAAFSSTVILLPTYPSGDSSLPFSPLKSYSPLPNHIGFLSMGFLQPFTKTGCIFSSLPVC